MIKGSGIYRIVDLKGRSYIGSSENIKRRWQQHSNELRKNKHENRKLQAYYNKYGKDSIHLEIVELTELDLIVREQFYIDSLKPKYNHCLIAGKPPSWAGKKHSPETIAKIKNVKWKHSPESILRMKAAKALPEYKQKISASLKKAYALGKTTFKGKHHSEETKKRLAEILTGKKRTEESKHRMRIAQRGKKASEETKQKMRTAQIGRKHSPETLERCRLAAIKRFQNPEYRAKQLIHLRRLSDAKIKK